MKPLIATLAGLLGTACLVTAAPRQPTTGTLSVDAEPVGCTVSINHTQRGTTPLTLELPPGDYGVAVRHEGYRPEYRRATVEEGMRRSIHLELTPLTGLLLVHSTPAGAEITIDELAYGQTPKLINTLPLGSHRVQLDLPGYRSKTVEVLLSDRMPKHIKMDLTSDSATLNIEATVAAAEVMINGVFRGTAPCMVDRIPAGEVVLEVRAPGYRAFTQIVKLAEGEAQSINVRLEEQPATLNIVSIPDGARVYLNNEFKGICPLTLPPLAPGEHRVRVEQAGFDATARTLTLARGENRTEEFRLSGNTGRLLITTEPDGVTVLVNGQDRGKTTAAAGEGLRASAPFALETLPEGAYNLQFVRPGYVEKLETLEVKRGQTGTLHVRLERRFIPNYAVTTASGTYRGVFESLTPEALRLETAPGVTSTYLTKDIRQHGPLPDASTPIAP